MEEVQTPLQIAASVFYVAATFGFIVLVTWIKRFYMAKSRRESLEAIRAAIQAGQTLTPETVRAITLDYDPARNDLRWGLMLIAAALAILVVALLAPTGFGDEDIPSNFKWLVTAGAAFPGFVGVARLILHFTQPKGID